MKYRPEIDGLRAVAVVPVLLFHGGFALFPGGYLGVDVFFVISGFLITTILLKSIKDGTFGFTRFLERRIRRLFPAAFAVMAASLLVGATISLPEDLKRLGYGTVGAATHLANVVWWLTIGYWGRSSEENPLIHTWSLAVEEQFYFLFPAFLFVLFKIHRRAMPWGIAGVLTISLALCVWLGNDDPRGTFFLLPFRAWELMVGSCGAILTARLDRQQLKSPFAAALGLAMIIVTMIVYDESHSTPGLLTVIPCVGTLIVLLTASADSGLGRLLSSRIVVGIGLISYSLYLWHQPILAYGRQVAVHDLDALTTWVLLASSFPLAYLSWRWIERPTRSSSFLPGGGLWASWTIGTLALVMVGATFFALDGWPQRLPADVRAELKQAHEPQCPDHPCLRDTGVQRVLLWGDSHAGALKRAIFDKAIATDRDFISAISAGCPPMVRDLLAPDRKTRECARHNEQVLQQALNERTETVVLASRWLSSLGLGDPATCNLDERPYDALTPADPMLIEHFHFLVSTLIAANKQVVIVNQTPEPRCAPPETRAHRIWWGQPTALEDLSLDVASYAPMYAILAPIMQHARQSGASIVEPMEALCSDTCDVERDGKYLFVDDDHVSVYGARIVLADAPI